MKVARCPILAPALFFGLSLGQASLDYSSLLNDGTDVLWADISSDRNFSWVVSFKFFPLPL